MIMQKMALRKDSMALPFYCNRVIIRFRVVGNSGVAAKFHANNGAESSGSYGVRLL